MKNKNPSKVTAFPARALTGALVLSIVVLVALIWFMLDSYRNVTAGQQHNLRIEGLRGTIVHLDEVLTMSARMAAATGDSNWERRYRQFEPQLDAALKEAMLLTAHSDSAEAVAQTDAANLKLVEMENLGFDLVRAGEAARARAVLFGDAYEAQKKIYAEGIGTLTQHLSEQLAANLLKKQYEAIFSIIAVVCCIVLFLFAWLSVLRRLEKAHRELVAASRQAGMAEIATNVLHNVGNILNGVNVSADLVSSTLRTSRAQGLTRAVQLMNAHAADLGDFLTLDDKGKLLPGYLSRIAQALAQEQQGMIEELGHLTQSIDHIKDVVATQQSYAGVSSVIVPVQICDLAEDALRMNGGALARHQVPVVKEFAQVPVVRLDQARVLQILVNLISNAKNAMAGMAGMAGMTGSHQITLRVDVAGSSLRVSVKDEGEGITEENLTRIFAHGFTTHKAGHGFGLHSCALAARQMGGALTAHSDGPGRGATFTLELPLDTAQAKP